MERALAYEPGQGAEPKWNLYVEEIKTGAVKQLTTDASDDIIDGTSDWNNNEEFSLPDCFQWSPDGKKIAYYQFDQSGVQDFALINYTDTLYPVITKYKYPEAGPNQFGRTAGGSERRGRPHALAQDSGRPAQYLHPLHGVDGR